MRPNSSWQTAKAHHGRIELARRLLEDDAHRLGVGQRRLVEALAAQGVVDVGQRPRAAPPAG